MGLICELIVRLRGLIAFFSLVAFPLFSVGEVGYIVDLQMAEEIALENNQQLLAMNELYKRVKEAKFESISKWLPEVSAISQLYDNQKIQLLGSAKRTFVTQLSLTQALFSTNKYFDVKLASLQIEHLKLLLEALENDILFDVRSLYYKIALDHEQIQTAKEHIDILTSLSRQMQDQYQIGTQIILNVNQSKVAVANAMTIYYQRIKDLRSDRDAFVELLGYEPGEIELDIADVSIPVRGVDELRDRIERVDEIFASVGEGTTIYKEGFPKTQELVMHNLFNISDIVSWEEIARQKNPLLKSRSNEIAIANENVKKSLGEYFPSINFVANFGGEPNPFNPYPEPTIGSQQFQWGLGLELRWMIFDGLGRESRVKQSRYLRSAKEYEYHHSRQSTMKEIRDQIYLIEEGIASFATAEGNIYLSDQTLLQAKDQFDIGYITIYDYETAINSVIEARNKVSQSAFDLIHAYYGLRHVSGIDLKQAREYGK
ncbi:MAG: TolC family protein [Simkaniaceae bacterium]|nr:TolC family protein [Simkaniaceae bacterium]